MLINECDVPFNSRVYLKNCEASENKMKENLANVNKWNK